LSTNWPGLSSSKKGSTQDIFLKIGYLENIGIFRNVSIFLMAQPCVFLASYLKNAHFYAKKIQHSDLPLEKCILCY